MPETAIQVQDPEALPEKWEILAKAVSEGASDKELFNLSIQLKVRPDQMDRIKLDGRFAKNVERKVRTLALYAVARAMPQIEKLSIKSVPAFTALAKIAGAWPGSEVNINTNVQVGDRSGDNDSDRAFHVAFHQRLRSGLVQRLIVLEGGKPLDPSLEVKHDPPVDPPEPTEEPEPEPDPNPGP